MVVDPSSSFPTAQWAAALRALDATDPSKSLIGANIDSVPDFTAAVFQGDVGRNFAQQYFTVLGGDEEASRNSIGARTQFLDKHWMMALERNCRQFVILGAGLDGRAWRLPRMTDSKIRVFELDTQRAIDYKQGIIAQHPEIFKQLICQHTMIPADLSSCSWPSELQVIIYAVFALEIRSQLQYFFVFSC